MSTFKEKFCKENTLQQRKDESSKILKKFTNKLPIVISEGDNSIELDKHKYLVPRDLTIAQLLYVVRQRSQTISSEKALYLSIKNTINSSSKAGGLTDFFHYQAKENALIKGINGIIKNM